MLERVSGVPPAKAPRLTFVDLLRLVAALQMINGHTLDALIRPEYAQGDFYLRYVW